MAISTITPSPFEYAWQKQICTQMCVYKFMHVPDMSSYFRLNVYIHLIHIIHQTGPYKKRWFKQKILCLSVCICAGTCVFANTKQAHPYVFPKGKWALNLTIWIWESENRTKTVFICKPWLLSKKGFSHKFTKISDEVMWQPVIVQVWYCVLFPD